MKILSSITLAIFTIFTSTTTLRCQAQQADLTDQYQFPQVTVQPVDQAVMIGSNATFSVQAVNGDSYQWLSNGIAMEGQTNTTLMLQNVGISSAATYSCTVSQAGGDAVPTRAAALNVVAPLDSTGNGIVVYAAVRQTGGTMGTCPGAYAGYVSYSKTVAQGWGWTPSTNTTTYFAAFDGSGRTDTIVTYQGKNSDGGCNQTVVAIPNPPISSSYRFTIYFPSNVPTTNYPIVLTGFNP